VGAEGDGVADVPAAVLGAVVGGVVGVLGGVGVLVEGVGSPVVGLVVVCESDELAVSVGAVPPHPVTAPRQSAAQARALAAARVRIGDISLSGGAAPA
jgi:hypothetical protein